MKKTVSLIMVAIFMLSTFAFATDVSAAEVPTITVSTVEAEKGAQVVLAASVSSNPGINAFALGVEYDTEKLEFVKAEPAENVGGSFVYSKKIVWGTSRDSTYNGEFFYLTFKVKEDAEGTAAVTLTYNEGDICNYDEEDVNFTVVSGGVTVTEETPGVTVIVGDADGNGKVTPKDVLAIRKMLGGVIIDNEGTVKTACDVDGDGKVTPKDVLAVRKYLGGVIGQL